MACSPSKKSPAVDPRDSLQAAKAAGLRYVSDPQRGIARKRAGKHFSYIAADGTVLRDKEALARIRALVIPPAWTKVWISPLPHGHLQATGRDARGRKQYRYHPRWREVRDETKYERMIPFAETLARIVRKCQAIEGEELFHYVDETGETRSIESGDVNEYLRTIAGEDFTAKDFRTWGGTVLAAEALRELDFESATEAKRNIVQAIKSVAERLGNTPSVCRKCYVHPAVLDGYEEGALAQALTAVRSTEAALKLFMTSERAPRYRTVESTITQS
ncbi:MAG: hypothetical protein ABIP39_06335 [Polyangiaceae bacterium]